MFNTAKGWSGDKTTALLLSMKLDKEDHPHYNDLVVELGDKCAQIEHVVLSKYGIFVIRTENYNGTISVSDEDRWTLAGITMKHKFANPLNRTAMYIATLSEALGIDSSKFHPVIWFTGDATFENETPPNILTGRIEDYIQSFQDEILSKEELLKAHAVIKAIQAG